MTYEPNKPLNPEVFESYLLGRLTDEQVQAFERLLKEDSAALKQLAEAMQVMSLVRHEFAGQAEYLAVHQREPLLEDFNALLMDLAAREAAAQTMTLLVEPEGVEQQDDPGSLSSHDYAAVACYVLRKTVTSKPFRIAVGGLAAAIVLLVAVLLVPWGTGVDPVKTPIANQQDPQNQLRGSTVHVATLTNQHDAEWLGPDPLVGDGFEKGKHLQLIAGFAEITTSRGAVAILEAPATIELLDNSNAIRLHTGKLVGICETESSKGFVVKTGHADITDLGTVFAVECDKQGRTTAGVIRGRIVVAVPDSPAIPRVIDAGQLVRVNDDQTTTDLEPAGLQRFRTIAHVLRPVRVAGEAVLIDHIPQDLAEDGAVLQVFREATDVPIDEPITVNQTQTGPFDPDKFEEVTLQAGGRVDSYLIHYDRPNQSKYVRRQCTITFEQPVVALVLSTELLEATDGMLGVKGVRYPKGPRGIDLPSGGADLIELSDDRKTLTISLIAADIDSLRVLTQSPITPGRVGQGL